VFLKVDLIVVMSGMNVKFARAMCDVCDFFLLVEECAVACQKSILTNDIDPILSRNLLSVFTYQICIP